VFTHHGGGWIPRDWFALRIPNRLVDEAVASVIREYRQRTGVELDEPAVRAGVASAEGEGRWGGGLTCSTPSLQHNFSLVDNYCLRVVFLQGSIDAWSTLLRYAEQPV
jgi:hypothetical protein